MCGDYLQKALVEESVCVYFVLSFVLFMLLYVSLQPYLIYIVCPCLPILLKVLLDTNQPA